jgi:SAM-dependent methyltransferase
VTSSTPFTEAGLYDAMGPGSQRSAELIVPIVIELLAPRSVLDVGAGTGAWLAAFAAAGVDDVQGVEGGRPTGEQLLVPADRIKWHDLEEPFELGRRFDLVVSLEVAEHLPAARADQFVAMLTNHADAVLFSAAIPNQGGNHHINEQWPTYWATRFADRGYACFDPIRDRIWSDDRIEWWYRQNTLIYARGDAAARLEALGFAAGPPRQLVHPDLYLLVHEMVGHMRGIRAQARGLVAAVRNRVRGR